MMRPKSIGHSVILNVVKNLRRIEILRFVEEAERRFLRTGNYR